MPPAHKTLEGQESGTDQLQDLTGNRHSEVLPQAHSRQVQYISSLPFSEAMDSSLSTGQGLEGPGVSERQHSLCSSSVCSVTLVLWKGFSFSGILVLTSVAKVNAG